MFTISRTFAGRRAAGVTAAFTLAMTIGTGAGAQTLPPLHESADLSGPRFGITILSPGVVTALARRDIRLGSVITQYGWQWEHLSFVRDSGTTMVHEFVFLLGGLEQNRMIPSLSWLVGMRRRDGVEFGIGPNLSMSGPSLVFAAGITLRTTSFNVPLNVAVVPSRSGVRVSLLTGLSLRRR
jgi:hypothetical protein